MKIADKLSKVDDSFSVQLYDNGFMFEVSGRDDNDEWASAKILCNTLDDLQLLIKEATALPRN